jgi:antitoxin component of MazEF toxin-antitoxin module
MSKHQILGKSVRKLVKVGNSIGITLPAEYLRAHNLELGGSMEICFDRILHAEPLDLMKIQRALEHESEEKEKPLSSPRVRSLQKGQRSAMKG